MPWICSIYEKRPDLCKRYPEPGSFIPPSCGYSFLGDGTRRGRCEPECEATCCKMPRVDGVPDATALPEAVGGQPCKHLVYTEKEIEYAPEKIERVEPGVVGDQPDDAELET